jgi:hypothetical protein
MIPALLPANWEGEIVTTRFASDPKIGAGAPPLCSMRRDAAPAGPKLCEQMRQFMTESAINFLLTVFGQAAIEHDAHGAEFRAASGRAETA